MEDGGKIVKEEGGGRVGVFKFYYVCNIFFILDWIGFFLVRCFVGKVVFCWLGIFLFFFVYLLGFIVIVVLLVIE